MPRLIPLSRLGNTQSNYSAEAGSFMGKPAVGTNDIPIGTVRDVLVDADNGRLRYFVVNIGRHASEEDVLVPVGMARVEDDAVFFGNLTLDQARQLQHYRPEADVTLESQLRDESVLRGTTYQASTDTNAHFDYRDQDAGDTLFKTPQRLVLLEERVIVEKHWEKVGEVVISKHVETHPEQVDVSLAREEVVIERHPVASPQPVQGTTLGSGGETVHVDLEAERAKVQKQAYVTEEVEVRKEIVTEVETFTVPVRREVLDVEPAGAMDVAVTRDEGGQ